MLEIAGPDGAQEGLTVLPSVALTLAVVALASTRRPFGAADAGGEPAKFRYTEVQISLSTAAPAKRRARVARSGTLR
jgi:hypothetical protein